MAQRCDVDRIVFCAFECGGSIFHQCDGYNLHRHIGKEGDVNSSPYKQRNSRNCCLLLLYLLSKGNTGYAGARLNCSTRRNTSEGGDFINAKQIVIFLKDLILGHTGTDINYKSFQVQEDKMDQLVYK